MAKSTGKRAASGGYSGFASRLRDALSYRRITARALSETTRIPYRSLQNYIRGEHAMPCPALKKVSDALGVSADWLLSERPCYFDMAVLEDSLTIFEDLRGLSGYKLSIKEAAPLFVKYYEKFYIEKLMRTDTGVVPRRGAEGRPTRQD